MALILKGQSCRISVIIIIHALVIFRWAHWLLWLLCVAYGNRTGCCHCRSNHWISGYSAFQCQKWFIQVWITCVNVCEFRCTIFTNRYSHIHDSILWTGSSGGMNSIHWYSLKITSFKEREREMWYSHCVSLVSVSISICLLQMICS